MKKELEQLKTELKNTCSELSASESRLKRALQDVEKQKISLKNLRQEEKVIWINKKRFLKLVFQESKDEYRKNLKDLNTTVKQIQKHKNELLQGYKKQIQLIDNLKRQKV